MTTANLTLERRRVKLLSCKSMFSRCTPSSPQINNYAFSILLQRAPASLCSLPTLLRPVLPFQASDMSSTPVEQKRRSTISSQACRASRSVGLVKQAQANELVVQDE